VKRSGTDERITVCDVKIRLNNPDKFFAWVIEIQLNFVGRRTDGLVTSELKLLNEVLMGILGHASALIGIKENVIDVKRSGDERFCVSIGNLLTSSSRGMHFMDSEKTFVKRADLDVNFDLVVLEGNKGKCKSWVATEPELERDVKSSLRECVTWGTDCLWDTSGTTCRCNLRKFRVSQVSKLGSLSNHLVVSGLLLTGKRKLVPDVHPVTVLSVNALTTNLNLNHRDKLLTGVV
jgi:hypothetical protein